MKNKCLVLILSMLVSAVAFAGGSQSVEGLYCTIQNNAQPETRADVVSLLFQPQNKFASGSFSYLLEKSYVVSVHQCNHRSAENCLLVISEVLTDDNNEPTPGNTRFSEVTFDSEGNYSDKITFQYADLSQTIFDLSCRKASFAVEESSQASSTKIMRELERLGDQFNRFYENAEDDVKKGAATIGNQIQRTYEKAEEDFKEEAPVVIDQIERTYEEAEKDFKKEAPKILDQGKEELKRFEKKIKKWFSLLSGSEHSIN